jgi:hypothetical protein
MLKMMLPLDKISFLMDVRYGNHMIEIKILMVQNDISETLRIKKK